MGGTSDVSGPLAAVAGAAVAEDKCAAAAETVADITIAAGGVVSAVALGLQSLEGLPPAVRSAGAEVHNLVLSENDISSLSGLDCFPALQTLVLDNNRLKGCSGMPTLAHLETLWLNKNDVHDLDELLDVLAERCPKLSYLSLLGNAVCKNDLVGATKDEAERYRTYVVHRVPTLRFLDAQPVSEAERRRAKERGQYLRVKPGQASVRAAPRETSKFYKDQGREGQHSTFLGYQAHAYTGKSSEGNRFIKDEML
eukprot:TRINITY_DN11416_c0_g2_i1.p1 TRINITY_DN11416_c0_g2~~TRINITY_DN11416_c0_g2_i1.p1  ORF type:complete len:281 (+),score=106.65 TRINITY_DN11416_c0_g2_i1:83-844(+)